MKPIIVLGPMDCEICSLSNRLENKTIRQIGGFTFTEGTVNGCPVITVKCLIGVVNSSSAVTLAIREYDPSCVIIQGTSGGHGPDNHKYDIILGKNFVELGSFYTKHRDAGCGTDYADAEFPGAEIPVNGQPVRINTLHSDEKLLEIASGIRYTKGKLKAGTIGSSDIWNKEIDRILFLKNALGTDCEEMEGFGVAQVCSHFNVPVMGIRIVSNNEMYPDEKFSEDTGETCQEFTYEFLKKLTE